ncbi:MAG TPA: hypothetical protein VFI31_25045 [Pirellulales bacterium]|nr:hypothetical protein [Pirellulales bacterium]
MHYPDGLFILPLFLSSSALHLAPTPLVAYVGLGPSPEFVPYFLALLGVVGAALIAFLQWPILTLRAYFRRKRSEGRAELPSVPADADQMPRDADHDRPVS